MLGSLQSHPPALEKLINGQMVTRHFKEIQGPSTTWEPFGSPSLLPSQWQGFSN